MRKMKPEVTREEFEKLKTYMIEELTKLRTDLITLESMEARLPASLYDVD